MSGTVAAAVIAGAFALFSGVLALVASNRASQRGSQAQEAANKVGEQQLALDGLTTLVREQRTEIERVRDDCQKQIGGLRTDLSAEREAHAETREDVAALRLIVRAEIEDVANDMARRPEHP